MNDSNVTRSGARTTASSVAGGRLRLASAGAAAPTSACGPRGRLRGAAASRERAPAAVSADRVVSAAGVIGRSRAVVLLSERQRLLSERSDVSGAVGQSSGTRQVTDRAVLNLSSRSI